MKTKNQGFTIVEMVLVFVIGMSLLYLSLRQYQVWQRDSEIRTVQYNVDGLFAAMALYFRAHCADPNHPLGQATTDPYVVTTTTLENEGYYSTNQLRMSPLVSTSGYVLQFNPAQPNRTYPMSDGTNHNMGVILHWRAQVGALLNVTVHQPTELKNVLLADCLSSLSGTFVRPCKIASGTTYAVWERSISFPSLGNVPNTWISQSRVPLFKQLYTTYPITDSADTNQWSSLGSTQYFRCVN